MYSSLAAMQAAYKGVLGKASALGNTVRLLASGSKRRHDDGALEVGASPPCWATAAGSCELLTLGLAGCGASYPA